MLQIDELDIPMLQEADLKDKVVLVRVDHNVVKKGLIHDPYRIDATLGTIYYINAKGGKVILMTHIGRPRDKKTGEIKVSDATSVAPIVEYLENKLHVKFAIPEFEENGKYGIKHISTSINHLLKDLKAGELDGIYLPNTRWFEGEEAGNEKAEAFAYELAGLADIFVNDAFGSWQPHASTVDVAGFLPSYMGFLMQREISNLKRIYQPQQPFTAVVAGSKFDTKIESLFALLREADHLVLGGVIYNAYLSAKYGFKIEGLGEDDVEQAKRFVEYAADYPGKLIELPFIVESDYADQRLEGEYRTHDIRELPQGHRLKYVLDVAPESFMDQNVRQLFMASKTIFVNAVMGFTPHFNEGTIALDSLIDKNGAAVKLYGGGDTMQELKRLLPGLYIVALDSPKYYIFTGGGAVLKAIQEGSVSGLLPVKALARHE